MTNIIKKIGKIILILVILQLIFAVGNISRADGGLDNIINAGDDFLMTGKVEALHAISSTNTKQIVNDIYSILFPIGVAATVIVGGILGIKFMMASAEDKAKVKESLIPYVIGCIVIYGAFGIWKIVIEVLSNIS